MAILNLSVSDMSGGGCRSWTKKQRAVRTESDTESESVKGTLGVKVQDDEKLTNSREYYKQGRGIIVSLQRA